MIALPRVPVRLPDLGDEAARFGLWRVDPGEQVRAGECLAEVLLQGACVEVVAPVDGRLVEQLVRPREPITPGQVLALIEGDTDDPS